MALADACRRTCSGSRRFKAAYKKALSLERKTILGLNVLLRSIPSCVAPTDAITADVLSDVLTLEQLHELSYVWAKARDAMRAALVTLTSEPAQRLYYRSAPMAETPRGSALRRWVINHVRIS